MVAFSAMKALVPRGSVRRAVSTFSPSLVVTELPRLVVDICVLALAIFSLTRAVLSVPSSLSGSLGASRMIVRAVLTSDFWLSAWLEVVVPSVPFNGSPVFPSDE